MRAGGLLAPGFTPGQLVAAVRAALLAEAAPVAPATSVADALQLGKRQREELALISISTGGDQPRDRRRAARRH